MMKFHYKLVVALLALAVGFISPVYAEEPTEVPTPTTTPKTGLSLEGFPEGLCVVVIDQIEDNLGWTVNRNAKGYISMYQDGVLIRQIPASNRQRLVTFVPEGEGEIKKDNANLRITFYDSATNPANTAGTYTITVPAGFVYYAGNPELTNPEWTFTIKCVGATVSPLTITPTAGKTYSNLDQFTVTLPEVVNYRFNPTLPAVTLTQTIEAAEGDNDADIVTTIPCTVTVSESVATIIPTTIPDKIANYTLNIPDGFAQKKKVSDGEVSWSDITGQSYDYKMSIRLNQPAIAPPTDQIYPFFESTPVDVMIGAATVTRHALFTLSLDQDFMYALMTRPIWCPVDENGLYNTDDGLKLAIAANAAVDKRTLYVLTESIDGGDFLPAPGKYALVLPSGCFYLKDANGNQAVNPELVYYYTVGVNPDFKYIIKPSDNTETRELQYFTVTFDEGTEIVCRTSAYAQLSNGIAVYALPGTVDASLSNEVRFALEEPLTELGKWTFSLPSSGFTVNGSPLSLSSTYTIVDRDPVDKTCVVTPGQGKVESLSEFHITFAAHEGFFGREGGGGISLVRLPDTEIPLENPGYYDFDNNYYVIALTEATSTPGDYILTIKPDTFWVGEEDGFANDKVEVRYVITEPVVIDKTCVVTPAAGTVAELTDFHITFAAHEGFFGREGGGGVSLVRLPDTDVALDNPGYYDFDNNYYVIALTEATSTPGEYVLTILPETFWVGEENGFANDEVKVNYVINESSESVDSIELENARGDVFNAAGIRVAADVTLDDVLRLDKGLYIFCGHKVIVK